MWLVNFNNGGWDVGFYTPLGRWVSHVVFPDKDDNGDSIPSAKFVAEDKAHYLNGGEPFHQIPSIGPTADLAAKRVGKPTFQPQ
jgi:hypothetical protein